MEEAKRLTFHRDMTVETRRQAKASREVIPSADKASGEREQKRRDRSDSESEQESIDDREYRRDQSKISSIAKIRGGKN